MYKPNSGSANADGGSIYLATNVIWKNKGETWKYVCNDIAYVFVTIDVPINLCVKIKWYESVANIQIGIHINEPCQMYKGV